jgi:hypothetical protein
MISNFNRQDAARSMDRRTIRVELPSDDAGILDALRRAFAEDAQCESDRDFASLLRQLH